VNNQSNEVVSWDLSDLITAVLLVQWSTSIISTTMTNYHHLFVSAIVFSPPWDIIESTINCNNKRAYLTSHFLHPVRIRVRILVLSIPLRVARSD
jgi:hypothetical protein